jgi:hypothetical protein
MYHPSDTLAIMTLMAVAILLLVGLAAGWAAVVVPAQPRGAAV